MPATGRPTSSSSALEPNLSGSSTFPLVGSAPKTPKNKCHATISIQKSTPTSRGTSILPRLEPDTDEPQKYGAIKYEQYIAQDFERHRVFVDIDVFMENVLHVPKNWKDLWGPIIKKIKLNKGFSKACTLYTSECEQVSGGETRFYKPLVDMGNAILRVSGSSNNDLIKPKSPQRYLRNDPKKILGGVMNDLSPDIVAVHGGLLPHLSPEERKEGHLNETNLNWAQPLHVLEVKPWGGALVDGSSMPRLKVNGRDPYTPPQPAEKGAKSTKSDDKSYLVPDVPLRKRRASQSPEPNRKSQRLNRKSTAGGSNRTVGNKIPQKPRGIETIDQKKAARQVGRYLVEQFSVPAFRSHATIGLVDRNRVQFYHANHSVILVSSAIGFSTADPEDEQDRFIAIVIAFSRLSLSESGILHNLHNGKLFEGNKNLPTSKINPGTVCVQQGNTLEFGGDGKMKPFTLTYGEAISHEPSLAGRSTAVLHAKCPKWKDIDLVVKISWPGSERVAENEFLEKAIRIAKSSTKNEWALNHLPQVLHAQDVVFDENSTHEKVARLLTNAEFANGEYKYERRTLRIIVQERLYPLKTLTNAKDIGQVLLDVACIHRWLYERAGILHRDLSLNNIMYRIIDGKVYGVLADYDLASWKASLTSNYQKTSQQRTGTPPFMANGLLDGTDALHLYRHDVESLFHVMLILATHYEIQAPEQGEGGGVRVREGTLQFEDWFDAPNYNTLGRIKSDFFTKPRIFEVSPSFKDFRGWLLKLRKAFSEGFSAKNHHDRQKYFLLEDGEDDKLVPFDDETLGGHVTYSAIVQPACHLKGELEGLVIRYHSPEGSHLTSTGAIQVDA